MSESTEQNRWNNKHFKIPSPRSGSRLDLSPYVSFKLFISIKCRTPTNSNNNNFTYILNNNMPFLKTEYVLERKIIKRYIYSLWIYFSYWLTRITLPNNIMPARPSTNFNVITSLHFYNVMCGNKRVQHS